MCWVHRVAPESWGSGRRSREVPSALYSRSSRARGTRRRIGGFEGWGRHLSCGPAAAATPTFALTHPSNLRETRRLTTPLPSSQFPRPSRVQRGDRVRMMSRGAGRIHRPIPKEGIENAGQPTGDLLPGFYRVSTGELPPTSYSRSQGRWRQPRVFTVLCCSGLEGVQAGYRLITQRSLVQIRPPQPLTTRG